MKWNKNKIFTILSVFLIGSLVIGAGIQQSFPTDILKLGIGTSTDDKEFVFDTGDGATNPKIVIDMVNKDFDFNKAVNVAADLLTVGDGSNTNKVIEFNIGLGATNPKFRWDSAANKLQFSADGVNFKDIGSGSGSGGGGINFGAADVNFDLESGTDSWVATVPANFTSETSTQINGEASGLWDPAAASETLSSALVTVTEAGRGKSTCLAIFSYQWSGTEGEITAILEDAADVKIADFSLPTTGGDTRFAATPFFDCPSPTTQVRVQFDSTADAAPIKFDDVFVGVDRNTFQLEGYELTAYAYYPAVAACNQWDNASTSYADFNQDAGCESIIVLSSTQTVDTTDDNLPNLVFPELKQGKYRITVNGFLVSGSGGQNTMGLRITDGTTNGQECGHTASAGGEGMTVTCTMVIDYNTTAPRSFKVQGFAQAGAVTLTNNFGGRQLVWQVEKLPTNTSQALTIETVGKRFSANVSGANIALNNGDQTAPIINQMNAGTLTLTNNAGFSSGPQIACNGVVSTGGTCSGANEVLGWVIPIDRAGRWKICAKGGHLVHSVNNGRTIYTFRWLEIIEGTTSTLQTGVEMDLFDHSDAGSATHGSDFSLCEVFTFNSVGRKSLQIGYTHEAINTVVDAQILIDGSGGTAFNRAMTFTAERIDDQQPSPIFTDLQNTLNNKVRNDAPDTTVIKAAGIDISGGTPVVVRENNAWINSLADAGSGTTTLFFQAGVFDGVTVPECVCTAISGAEPSCKILSSPSSVEVRTFDIAGTNVDSAFSIICMGRRP